MGDPSTPDGSSFAPPRMYLSSGRDVRAFDELDEVTYPPVEFDEDGNPTNFVFEPGGPNEYSVVRATIEHQFFTPFMDKLFRIGPDMPAIVNSFCIVKNEPWV